MRIVQQNIYLKRCCNLIVCFVIGYCSFKLLLRINLIITAFLKPPQFRQQFFVKSAFRVNDSTIRLSIVMSHLNRSPLHFGYGSKKGKVKLICHQPKCPHEHSPPCELAGFIGIISNLTKADNQTHIFLYSNSLKDSKKLVITDVRSQNSTYPHQLGVCVQPIYLMTDYTLIIQFFEYWLHQGATKFYLYWESFSEEVQEIIKFYAETSGTDIEVIEWSMLPNFSNDSDSNPNAFWYRLEAFLGIFDCLHRARFTVKYIAQSDLDEIFYVQNNTLLGYLEKTSNVHPNLASLQILSKRIHVMNATFNETVHPSDFNFDTYKNLVIDSVPFKKPLYTKMIYRPERNFQVHIHKSFEPDGIAGKYKNFTVNPQEICVWHFRRLTDTFSKNETTQTTELTNDAKIWKESFNKRLKNGNLTKQIKWKSYVTTFGQEFERCRQLQSQQQFQICHSLFHCEQKLRFSYPWKRANNSWIVV